MRLYYSHRIIIWVDRTAHCSHASASSYNLISPWCIPTNFAIHTTVRVKWIRTLIGELTCKSDTVVGSLSEYTFSIPAKWAILSLAHCSYFRNWSNCSRAFSIFSILSRTKLFRLNRCSLSLVTLTDNADSSRLPARQEIAHSTSFSSASALAMSSVVDWNKYQCNNTLCIDVMSVVAPYLTSVRYNNTIIRVL